MKWKILIFGLVVILLFAAGYGYWKTRPTQQDVVQRVFDGQQNFDVFINPTNVTAQLLHARQGIDLDKDESHGKLNGYLLDAPISLTAEQKAKIQGLLRAPTSYEFRYEKACIPNYGLLLNFYSDKKIVRVALCFQCDILGVFTNKDENAESIAGGNFDPIHRKLAVFAKSIFPTDKGIQNLK